jgi:hypothetical protein
VGLGGRPRGIWYDMGMKDFLNYTAVICGVLAAVCWSLNFLLCSNEHDRDKWSLRLYGPFAERLDKMPIVDWPRAAADRFYALIVWVVGEDLFSNRGVLLSITFSVFSLWYLGGDR